MNNIMSHKNELKNVSNKLIITLYFSLNLKLIIIKRKTEQREM